MLVSFENSSYICSAALRMWQDMIRKRFGFWLFHICESRQLTRVFGIRKRSPWDGCMLSQHMFPKV